MYLNVTKTKDTRHQLKYHHLVVVVCMLWKRLTTTIGYEIVRVILWFVIFEK